MSSKKVPIATQINCGYARVALYELSETIKIKSRSMIDRKKLAEEFQKVFHSSPGYQNLPPEYWLNDNSLPAFNRHTNFILDCFSKKWSPYESRKEYISSFSLDNWSKLSLHQKSQHSLANCEGCLHSHFALQKAFPALPFFAGSSPIVDIHIPANVSEREVTRRALTDLNNSFQSSYQHSFVHSAIKFCGNSEAITHKKSVQSV